jgi:hypothetical protein
MPEPLFVVTVCCDPQRTCTICGAFLCRRKTEGIVAWERRRFCGSGCALKGRTWIPDADLVTLFQASGSFTEVSKATGLSLSGVSKRLRALGNNSAAVGGAAVRTLHDRFWEKVVKGIECWLWIGATTRRGYGAIHAAPPSRKILVASRVSWEIHYGAIPDGLFVCHRCDVPACVRPDHLFLGTDKENKADMMAKGRQRGPSNRKGVE